MLLPSLLLLAALGAPQSEQRLDGLPFADSAAASQAWVPSDKTPDIAVAKDNGRDVLEIRMPFAAQPDMERTIHDRNVKLDLSVPGEFTVEIAAPDPDAIAHVALYFRSGAGWYSSNTGLTRRGWQTLRFSKATFQTEGRPTGWDKIDGIRISMWRAMGKDSSVRVARIAASWHEVALVVPRTRPGDAEARTIRSAAGTVTDMLEELGLGADAVDEAALQRGALENRRVAILAHAPSLSAESINVLASFVQQGGKVLVCYSLPSRLEKALGFGRVKYVRPESEGQFAEVRFDADLPGLPKAIRQNSWNINVAEPVGQNARVIGRWFDPQGKPTGQAAMLLSDRGAFFSHILMPDDRENKKQLLAAILGHFHTPLWQQMAREQLDRAVRVGQFEGLGNLEQYIGASANVAAKERLKSGLERLSQARELVQRQTYSQAIAEASAARKLLVEAYLRAAPSRKTEGRAFWEHAGTGAYPGDWDRTAKELAANGFNMVIPNMLWGGSAHYASDILPRSETFRRYGDQIEQCVAAAHRHGLEVHVWKVNHNLSNAPKDFVAKLRKEGRTQVSASGEVHDWICPSHPENFKLELESMLEVARKYDVDGLHFDYIRYPDGDHCYCDGCRQRFEAESGQKVARWPADCYRGPRRAEYRDWRCRQITRLVEAVSREGRKIKPKIKISAAVFPTYPSCRESEGQDWPVWVKAGYLDFLCPMDYTESDTSFAGMVSSQLKLVEGRIPVYPGIGATATRMNLTSDRVVGQINTARALGAAGFTIFNLTGRTIESLAPGVGLGAGAEKASPPHRK